MNTKRSYFQIFRDCHDFRLFLGCLTSKKLPSSLSASDFQNEIPPKITTRTLIVFLKSSAIFKMVFNTKSSRRQIQKDKTCQKVQLNLIFTPLSKSVFCFSAVSISAIKVRLIKFKVQKTDRTCLWFDPLDQKKFWPWLWKNVILTELSICSKTLLLKTTPWFFLWNFEMIVLVFWKKSYRYIIVAGHIGFLIGLKFLNCQMYWFLLISNLVLSKTRPLIFSINALKDSFLRQKGFSSLNRQVLLTALES